MVPILFAWIGFTMSACKAFTPSEEGHALSITSSSKFDMKVNAFIQAWLVASIPIWRIHGESWLSHKA